MKLRHRKTPETLYKNYKTVQVMRPLEFTEGRDTFEDIKKSNIVRSSTGKGLKHFRVRYVQSNYKVVSEYPGVRLNIVRRWFIERRKVITRGV